MKKSLTAQIVFLVVMLVGLLLLGVEIFLGHMDPGRVIAFAIVTGVGLLGNCACAFWRVFAKK